MELLLRNNAEPNSQGGFFGNALQAASAAGHVDIINLLLEHKPPPIISAPGGRYGSALMAAIRSGSSDTVFALLEEKADPNLRSKVHGRPLEKAVDMGYAGEDIVKDLLEFKAEADVSPKGKAIHILHKAAIYNMPELVIYCLEAGCDISMTTTEGPSYRRRFGEFAREMTPLAFACAEGHDAMVRLSLRRGASLERHEDPSAVLWVAAYKGRADVVDTLISTFKAAHDPRQTATFIDQRPSPRSGYPILFAAATSRSSDTVGKLLDYGAKYESSHYNMLLATATFGRYLNAKCLLDYDRQGRIDVCIEKRASNGRTAVFEACEKNRQRIVKCLLDLGADYTIPDKYNSTPLHAATHHEIFGVISALVKKASEKNDPVAFHRFLNTQGVHDQTAMIHAAERGRLSYVNLLLDLGADYTITGDRGNTPLICAGQGGYDDVIIALLEKAKAADSDMRPFEHFLKAKNIDSRTALIDPVRTNKVPTVRLILSYCIECYSGKTADVTPLHSACYRGFTDIVALLLERFAQDLDIARSRSFLNKSSRQGRTALMDAVLPKERNQPRMDIIEMLLDHGTDYKIPHIGDYTPLHRASYGGHRELAKLLLSRASSDLELTRLISFVNHGHQT
ncbi:MAG: hypothetical protein Q9181_006254 [Wetmoreana brouardii]